MHTTTGPATARRTAATAAASVATRLPQPPRRRELRSDRPAAGLAGPDSDPAMRPAADRFGLGVASITPFAADGSVDLPRLVAHARRCLDEGCTSVTLFGTTGEGASLGFRERARMLDAFVAAGFDMRAQVLGGVAASAIEDAAAQARHIYAAGGRGILLAPPFYFKGPDDEGLYAWFSRVIEASGDARGVILYHLPSLTACRCRST